MNLFNGSVQYVPGLGYVQTSGGTRTNASGALHGEADVMMISGLGGLGQPQPPALSVSSSSSQGSSDLSSAPITEQIRRYVSIVPWWMWAGALALGAAAVILYLKYAKKE